MIEKNKAAETIVKVARQLVEKTERDPEGEVVRPGLGLQRSATHQVGIDLGIAESILGIQ